MLTRDISLVIKPTYRCNFTCDFCSTVGDDALTLDTDLLLDFITRMSRGHSLEAIISGGEPLLMGTDYFYRILAAPVDSVGIQSNGEIAYNNLDKWLPILKDERVKFGISFQLGDQRRNKKGNVFNREMFYRYQERFAKALEYYIFFIYVITNDNCSFESIDEIIEIANHFNIGFRISAVFKSGKGKNVYIPQYQSIRIFNYLLEKYPRESCRILPLKDFLLSDIPLCKCNYTPDCTNGIISIEPNGDLYTCCGLGDRYAEPVGHITDDIEKIEESISKVDLHHQIRVECEKCYNRDFCNSCYIRYLDIIEDSAENRDLYCIEMKKMHSHISRIRTALGLEPDIIALYNKNKKSLKYEKIAG